MNIRAGLYLLDGIDAPPLGLYSTRVERERLFAEAVVRHIRSVFLKTVVGVLSREPASHE
jgi:hypothetical protein